MFFLVTHQAFTSIKIHPERISKAGKDLVNDLDYEGIEFPVPTKDFGKTEKKKYLH